MEFKIELPKEIPADARVELARELEASAHVQTGAPKRDIDPAMTLFVVAATVQTIDILWKWFQAARERTKTKPFDVVISTAKGKRVHLNKVTLEELKKLLAE